MKRTILFFLAALIASVNVFANPEIPEKSGTEITEETTKLSEEEVRRINERIAEIEAMDISKLSLKEKIALKKELKEIEKATGLDNRISISVGGAIIILLLLIIIL